MAKMKAGMTNSPLVLSLSAIATKDLLNTLPKTTAPIKKPLALIINDKPTYERAKMGIGYVSQGREIIPRLTVKENLLLGLEARQKPVKKPEIPSEIFSLFPVLKTMLSRMGGDLRDRKSVV